MPRQPAKAWDEVEGTKEADAARDVDEGRIAAEAFVGSKTAQSDLDASFTRGLGDKPGIDAIDRGLVHRLHDRRIRQPSRLRLLRRLHNHHESHRKFLSGVIRRFIFVQVEAEQSVPPDWAQSAPAIRPLL